MTMQSLTKTRVVNDKKIKKSILKKTRDLFLKASIPLPSNQKIKEAMNYVLATQGLQAVFLGLKLKSLCEKCGECCRNCNPIGLGVEDIQEMAGYLQITIPDFYVRYVDVHNEGNAETPFKLKAVEPCCFLKDNSCTIYPTRPRVCRGYPFNTFPKVSFEPKCRFIINLIAFQTALSMLCPQPNVELKEALPEERSGILNWMLQGLQRLQTKQLQKQAQGELLQ